MFSNWIRRTETYQNINKHTENFVWNINRIGIIVRLIQCLDGLLTDKDKPINNEER